MEGKVQRTKTKVPRNKERERERGGGREREREREGEGECGPDKRTMKRGIIMKQWEEERKKRGEGRRTK